jgi:quercetin dioxygenase-like cupin family protein
LSNPASTGAKQLTVYADQEEHIYVVSGTVEHWIEQERRTLGPGDSVFMPPEVVHATFNIGAEDAKVIAILGPCVGDVGSRIWMFPATG